jgi:hypothetical protein
MRAFNELLASPLKALLTNAVQTHLRKVYITLQTIHRNKDLTQASI